MTTTTCGTCRFSVPRPLDGEGALECRHSPPRDGSFTKTNTTLWCGQWAGAPEAVATRIEAEGASAAPARNDEPAGKPPKARAKK